MTYNSNDVRTTPQALQGVTTQNTGGTGESISNSSSVIPGHQPAPGYTTVAGQPGYPAVAQPGGANVAVVPNSDGSGATGTNLNVVIQPAGTAGPGNAPMAGTTGQSTGSLGWTAQGIGYNEDDNALVVGPDGGTIQAVGGTTYSPLFTPVILHGSGSYTFAAISSLPSGITLNTSTGAVSVANTTSLGSYPLTFEVTDSVETWKTVQYEVTIDVIV